MEIPSTASRRRNSVLGLACLLLTLLLFAILPSFPALVWPATAVTSPKFPLRVLSDRLLILEWGLWLAGLLLAEPVLAWLSELRSPRRVARIAVPALAVFFACFIFRVGNHQFGAWDLGNAIDTGWRQIQGQRPYTDFTSPNPPGFNLGMLYAFRLFGVSWNADLYAIILFTVIALVWLVWLFRELELPEIHSVLLAATALVVAVLPLSFWWYNDVTPVLDCIFLLSALLLTRRPLALNAGASFVVSLALLLLMKPNHAGLLATGASLVLLALVKQRGRVLLLLVVASLGAVGLLLVHHVSIADLLASYRAIAVERGGLTFFGIHGRTRVQKLRLLLWALAIAAPLSTLLGPVRRSFHERRWDDLAFALLLLLSVPVMLYGMATDVDWKDLETPAVIAAAGIVVFGMRRTTPLLRTVFFAFLFTLVGSNLFYGAARIRILGIGAKQFFDYTENEHPIHDPFFANLRSTLYFDEVQAEARRAARSASGSVFMGPRLEFEYASLRLPSPRGWPVYYQPGTSFARSEEERLVQFWDDQQFQTLVFLGPDRQFYPPELLDLIARKYRAVPGYTHLEVYRRIPVPTER